ncbi:MAG: ABC transporter ATP-binding protein [Treponema sp.]|jgi:biotin transport system ATP-binding protein|nr:ABC transporter ATP-binding protein [Treponema sp.]MBQ5646216.1 ABC transporter ATP-binding protein [Treponema sp.]MBQ5848494.1 ABC transporter ATP-binding protein [Treponema sp.]MEE1057970.1 ABC transporter ATP-binding protein [Treponema sp.]
MNHIVLEVQNINRTFANGTIALQDVSFSVKKGEFLVIGGKNGSGKSVLMSLIAGLDKQTSGTIKCDEVGLVFQDANSQILGETPLEDVLFGLRNLQLKKQERLQKAEETLKQCGLFEKRDFQARVLSGGEKRRLAVAGILALDRDFIIFDEPFANLDLIGIKQVCAILKQLKEQNKTIIVLTHDLEKILGLADSFIILDSGKIKFNGTPEDGLKLNLEEYGIKNPLTSYNSVKDLFWI